MPKSMKLLKSLIFLELDFFLIGAVPPSDKYEKKNVSVMKE
jgi:hypothetical protein